MNFIPLNLCLVLLLALFITACSTTENEITVNQELPEISAPSGFEVTMLYSPSANGQGSWVSLTTDGQGRLLASDQYGKIYRISGLEDDIRVDSIELGIGSAQGLLWADGGLYVSVNGQADSTRKGSGLYFLTDEDGDDSFDEIKELVTLQGEGEHGPHSIISGPEGSLYLIAGNHTLVPEEFSSYLNGNWATDRLFTPILDPRGHANSVKPPGGWIARSDDKGNSWQVIASGFRNAYDIAFSANGDLFTYDSDMEWDLGSPWYRPTRICHVIPGAEFGWRSGSGKWPAYYPDNLPPVLNMGQGSPTGITFGYGAAFPENFQHSLFVSDWSFGTIYQVNLTPDGASYSAEKKEFISGAPLAVTDLVIGSDGNMYFTTGGRRGTSYLYRVSYVGDESTEKVPLEVQENDLHKEMVKMTNADLDASEAWNGLSSPDRFVRYAARVALEKKPVEEWKNLLRDATIPAEVIHGSIAAIRKNDQSLIPLVRTQLGRINGKELELEQQLSLIRAYGLLFSRTGTSDLRVKENLPDFPTGNQTLDRELAGLLAYLNDGSIIGPALTLMEESEEGLEADLTPVEVLERSEQYGPTIKAMHENRPAEQGLALAVSLSHMTAGWTDEFRDRYFRWFYRALQKSGGMSYKGFVEFVRVQALDQVPRSDRERLAEMSGEALLNEPLFNADVPPPAGPGRNWILSEAQQVAGDDNYSPDIDRGSELYQALLCAACHAINGKGGNVGPDLTQAGTRFTTRDLLVAMISPSESISDQYGAVLFTMKNGTTMVGRPVRTTGDSVFINTNPFSNTAVSVHVDSVEKQEPSPVSLMPAGLINRLNEDELRDLLAYLKAEH